SEPLIVAIPSGKWSVTFQRTALCAPVDPSRCEVLGCTPACTPDQTEINIPPPSIRYSFDDTDRIATRVAGRQHDLLRISPPVDWEIESGGIVSGSASALWDNTLYAGRDIGSLSGLSAFVPAPNTS